MSQILNHDRIVFSKDEGYADVSWTDRLGRTISSKVVLPKNVVRLLPFEAVVECQ